MSAPRVGGRVRRLRQERRLTQAAMAAELGISPSYLNLIESNARPLTVRVLLRLAERFGADVSALASEDDGRLASDLMEAFADPFFDGADVKASDVRELVQAFPAVGAAVVALYEAWRRGLGAPHGAGADGEEGVGEGTGEGAVLPSEEVHAFLQARGNHFPALEEEAEALWAEQGLALPTLAADLAAALSQRYAVDVAVLPAEAMGGALRRYDPLKRRLDLSEMLAPPGRAFHLARQLALMGARRAIDDAVAGGAFHSAEGEALARDALAGYLAAAVMMPYGRFLDAAKGCRHDLDVLGARFGASFEQVAHRLTTLRRQGAEGVPFHLLRVDGAGNISKRYSASGLRIARFGAACPRWAVYDAFAAPGAVRAQVSAMPDGTSYFCVARTVTPQGRRSLDRGRAGRVGRLAIGLGCPLRFARALVYSDGLDLDDPALAMPIGTSCRTCPRDDCADRAVPSPLMRLDVDENRRGTSAYAGVGR